MAERFFFDVPVYRLPESRYNAEMKDWAQAQMYSGTPEAVALRKAMDERYPDQKAAFEAHLWHKYGGMWRYNEIIGYIRLHFLGSQIRGEYYAVTSKRIVRTRSKTFAFKTWKLAPEIQLPHDPTSTEIRNGIEEYLCWCNKELKGRYIDDSIFRVLAPHVDWRSVYEQRT